MSPRNLYMNPFSSATSTRVISRNIIIIQILALKSSSPNSFSFKFSKYCLANWRLVGWQTGCKLPVGGQFGILSIFRFRNHWTQTHVFWTALHRNFFLSFCVVGVVVFVVLAPFTRPYMIILLSLLRLESVGRRWVDSWCIKFSRWEVMRDEMKRSWPGLS